MKEFIEKLIGRLEEYQGKSKLNFGNRGDFDFMEVDAVKEIVNQLAEEYKEINIPTIDAGELLVNGWIACSERLPKEATTYQVTEEVIINSKKQYVVDIRLFGTEGEWLCPSNRKIIAWMPLPAPYQPKGE